MRPHADPSGRAATAPGISPRRGNGRSLATESSGLLKSVGSNWALSLVQIAVGFILPPLLIHTLGESPYGLWQVLVSMTGFLTLLLLGVPMATVREFSQHLARNDQERLNRSIASAIGLYLFMGAAACLVGLVMYPLFDSWYTHGTDVTEAVAAQSRAAFLITVLQLAFGFVAQVPSAIMTAHRDFFVRNAIMIGGLCLRLVLIAWWLRADASLTILAWIITIQMFAEFGVAAQVVKLRYPGTRMGLAGFDRAEVRSIVAFSAYVLLLAIGYKLLFMTSPLILGKFWPKSVVTAFENGKSLVLYLTDFVLAIGAVAMPTAVKLKVEGREKDLVALFLQWSKIAFSLALVAGLYLLVLGTDFIRVWIGKPDFDSNAAGEVNFILMISHFVFLPVRGVGLPILMGLGKPERATVAFLVSGVLNLAIGLALVKPMGLTGVALGIAVADALFAFYVLVLVCRELGVAWMHWVRYVVVKALLGSVPVLGLLLLLKHFVPLHGRVPVILCGVASTALFAIVWVGYVYRNDPYVDVAARLRRLLGRNGKGPS